MAEFDTEGNIIVIHTWFSANGHETWSSDFM